MATKKKFLQAAAGTAAASSGGGAGGLNVEDVFSTYLYTGNGSINAIDNGIALAQENFGTSVALNLDVTSNSLTSSSDNDSLLISNNNIIDFGTGDFTVEFWVWVKDYGASTYADIIGGGNSEFGIGIYGGTIYYSKNGVINPLSTDVTSYLDGWMHVAVSRSSTTSRLFIDGVEKHSTSSDNNSFSSSSGVYVGRLGTRTYAVQGWISNLRVVKGTALYTSAFTPSTSDLTAVSGTALLLCNGDTPLVDASSNSHSVTINGEPKASTFGPFDAPDAGSGGMVWQKRRNTSENNRIFDTETGAGKYLITNSTAAQATDAGNGTFNSNGFSVNGNNWNTATGEYVSWTWRKAPKFFDIQTWTGNGTAGRTISHNLGSVPGFIIVKAYGQTRNWAVYHRSLGSDNIMFLNKVDGSSSTANWNNTDPTSSVITLGSGHNVNGSNYDYVAYIFAHNDGDANFGSDGSQDIIKCGNYTGNGSTDGPLINLGFEPEWVLIKNATQSSGNWNIFDKMRGIRTSGVDDYLSTNLADAEGSLFNSLDLTATGFQPKNGNAYINTSGDNYIYVAIRRGPMAVPTDATDVFAVVDNDNGNQSQPLFKTGFVTDMTIEKQTSGGDGYIFNRLTGQAYMNPNNTSAEGTGNAVTWDYMDGMGESASGNWYSWNWQRRPGFFDIVAYTGNGTSGRTISHNLGATPEMIWVKRRDTTQDWKVYHSGLTSAAYYLDLNGQTAESLSGVWASTDPTDAVFSVGSNNSVNASNGTYIAYLFSSVDGVSKLGSISHTTGVDTNVDCGFSNGARFVLWKQINASNSWGMVDVERGLVSGNDALLLLNTGDAQSTAYDLIDPLSSGFVFTGTFGTGTYIFYAVA